MWQKMNVMKDGMCVTHMLAIFLLYKGDSHHLLEKHNKEEDLRKETNKRQINQGKYDNEKDVRGGNDRTNITTERKEFR